MTTDAEVALNNALDLTRRLIDATRDTLLRNPTKEQVRALTLKRGQLEKRHTELQFRLRQLRDGIFRFESPSAAQIEQIKALSSEVDKISKQNKQASAILKIASAAIRDSDTLMGGMGPGKP